MTTDFYEWKSFLSRFGIEFTIRTLQRDEHELTTITIEAGSSPVLVQFIDGEFSVMFSIEK